MSDQPDGKAAVITGVSSGIGHAIATTLAGAGWHVFGSVRKNDDAESLRRELGGSFTPLLFDVADAAAIDRAATLVRGALGGRTLNGLVNNAGVALAGPIRYAPLDIFERSVDINLYGPLRVTQAFLPMLGADPAFRGAPGRIVNMSSVAGKIAAPFTAPYAASKHALEGFSEALRRELIPHGIDVVIVGPGAIRTPIWAKGEELDISPYADTEYVGPLTTMKNSLREYGNSGLPPETVGALVLDILTMKKPKTRYAILRNKFLMWTLPNLLPKRVVDNALAGRFGLKPRRKRES